VRILDVVQGTKEWEEARAQYRTASEAPAMMGASSNVSRSDLIRAYATGMGQEISDFVRQVVFERGHEVEALARPIAEGIVGEELFPATVVEEGSGLLASLDGWTVGGDVVWECKQWNKQKAAQVRDGAVPEEDVWQVVQQLVVTGAERALYMVSDGTEERTVWTWFSLPDGATTDLLAGWAQFDRDLAAWQPEEAPTEAVGRSPDALPALRIEVQGAVVASNLGAFREHALEVFRGIRTDLATDEDFADAEQTVKWCKGVEEKLEAAKEAALAQTSDIDELFRAIDSIREEARAKRLELDKLVKARKQQIRDEIVARARDDWRETVEQINAGLDGARLPEIPVDLAGALKGKRTVASLRDAADTELARAKAQAHRIADGIRVTLKAIDEAAKGFETLFPDRAVLALKSEEDAVAAVKLRIREQEDEQERRRQAAARRAAEEEARQATAQERAQAAPEAPRRENDVPVAPDQGEASLPLEAPQSEALAYPGERAVIHFVCEHFGVDPETAIDWMARAVDRYRRAA
jgi:predicted phage-related endonuclease